MDGTIRVVTVLCCALVLGLVVGALFLPGLVLPALLLMVLMPVVWVWYRPSAYEAGPESLHILWPGRRRMILRGQIESAQRVDMRSLSPMVRVGVGGLFGVFGWFWRPGKGWLEIYCTAQKDLVLLQIHGGHPLLLSPQDPAAFLASLGIKE